MITSNESLDLYGSESLVQRGWSNRSEARRYEDFKLATQSETRSLKAVEEPRTISDRRQEIHVVAIIERMSNDVRGSTKSKRPLVVSHLFCIRR